MPNHVTNELTFPRLTKKDDVEKFLSLFNEDGEFDFNRITPMPESLKIEKGTYSTLGLAIASNYKDLPRWSENASEVKLRLINFILNPRDGQSTFDRLKEITGIDDVESIELDNFDLEAVLNEKGSKEEKETYQEIKTLGEQALKNKQDHGFTDWYDWSVHNWGTKWCAYEHEGFEDKVSLKKAIQEGFVVIRFDTAWGAPLPIIEKVAGMFKEHELYFRWADEDIGSNCGHFKLRNGDPVDVDMPEDDMSKEEQGKWNLFALSVKNSDMELSEILEEYELSENGLPLDED